MAIVLAPQGASGTGICEITGTNMMQQWRLTSDGLLQHTNGRCVGSVKGSHEVKEGPCISLRSGGGGKFSKVATRVPLERELYEKARTRPAHPTSAPRPAPLQPPPGGKIHDG